MTHDQFAWMREAIYEPREHAFEQPRSRFRHIFISAAIVCMACGALIALSIN